MLYVEADKHVREERARTALSAVGLEEELYTHHTNQISGGQMQRVAIARALVNDPEIILADEPTGNLDTKTGVMVMETLRKLKDEQGKTIVLITHESEIARFSDRTIMLRDGKITDE
jgi:putative ABC transport system ATP-binding protein